MFTGVSLSKETCSGSMSKSGLSCYNGLVSTLCCVNREWKDSGPVGRAEKSGVPFFCPIHLSAFIPGVSAAIILNGSQEVEKRFRLVEKLRLFFEKYNHFNVKFRKFFGFNFLEKDGHAFSSPKQSNPVQSFKPPRMAGFLANHCKYFNMSYLSFDEQNCRH
jgi:hypothetical protein